MKIRIYPQEKKIWKDDSFLHLPNSSHWIATDPTALVYIWEDTYGHVRYANGRTETLPNIDNFDNLLSDFDTLKASLEEENILTLTELKTLLQQYIDWEAGFIRKMFTTNIPLQDLVYQRKQSEYKEYFEDQDDPDNHPERYPHISKEAAALGQTMFDVANNYRNNDVLWSSLSSSIEAIRVATKEAIRNAVDKDTAQAIYDAVDWSVLGIGQNVRHDEELS